MGKREKNDKNKEVNFKMKNKRKRRTNKELKKDFCCEYCKKSYSEKNSLNFHKKKSILMNSKKNNSKEKKEGKIMKLK